MKLRWTLTMFAAGALLLAGCGKDQKQPRTAQPGMTCNSLHDKNRKCAKHLATIITEKMTSNLPAATKKKLGDRIAKSIIEGDFLSKCRAEWRSKDKVDQQVKAALKKCLALADCQAYASCFLKAMDSRRKKP